MKQGKYSIIYKFFVTQIEFGYYRYGDCLPSIELLHEVYHASIRTVRSAYLQLQEDGYISLSPGRKTKVIYRIPAEECRRNGLDFYLARRDAIQAMNLAYKIVLLPLLREGCRRLRDRELRLIQEMATKLQEGDLYLSFLGGHEMLRTLKNAQVLDLYHEIVSFYQFPHTLNRREPLSRSGERLRLLADRAVAACERRDREEFFRVYLRIQDFLGEVVQAHLERAERERPAQEQLPFQWRVYRERPQVCYTLAARQIFKIWVSREFRPGEYLPSYAALSSAYSVSLSTVRRTVELLEDLGTAKPVHGVGTQVVAPSYCPDRLRRPAVKRIAAALMETIQILRFTLEELVLWISPEFQERGVQYAQKLREEKGDCCRSFFLCMEFLLRGERNQALSEIWAKLGETLLLGLPLLKAQPASGEGTGDCTEALVRSLETGDQVEFQGALQELTALISARAERLARAAQNR